MGHINKKVASALVPQETIEGKKVILDKDLAMLYGVEVKYSKRQVRRNADRFPSDFMFGLSKQEFKTWRYQFVTSNSSDKMGLRYPPYAFTESGVAMLSSVLNSTRAIHVNIQIIRTFIKLRQILSTHKTLAYKLERLDRKIKKHDEEIRTIFEAIRQLMAVPEKPKRRSRIALAYNKGWDMKIGGYEVKLFKVRNRKGYAAACSDHLTEGSTRQQAYSRMTKALRRRRKRIS